MFPIDQMHLKHLVCTKYVIITPAEGIIGYVGLDIHFDVTFTMPMRKYETDAYFYIGHISIKIPIINNEVLLSTDNLTVFPILSAVNSELDDGELMPEDLNNDYWIENFLPFCKTIYSRFLERTDVYKLKAEMLNKGSL